MFVGVGWCVFVCSTHGLEERCEGRAGSKKQAEGNSFLQYLKHALISDLQEYSKCSISGFLISVKERQVICLRFCCIEAQCSKIQAKNNNNKKRSESAWNAVCKIKCVNFVSASTSRGIFRFLKYSLIMPFQKSLFMSSLSLNSIQGALVYTYNKVWGVFSINELICSWIGFQWIKHLWIWSTTVCWAWKSEWEKGKKGERRRRGEEYPFARSP